MKKNARTSAIERVRRLILGFFLRRDSFFIQPVTRRVRSKNNLPKNPLQALTTKKLAVYISSRNNYEMLENEVLRNVDFEGFALINVDDNSSLENKKRGRTLCEKYNIIYIDNPKRGLQWGLQAVSDYLVSIQSTCKWVVHLTHDNYPVVPRFFSRIERGVLDGKLRELGTLGFNHLDLRATEKGTMGWKSQKKGLGILGRSVLVKMMHGGHWYRFPYLDYSTVDWETPFAVEAVCDTMLAINLELFRSCITVSDRYHLHLWADDICIQFAAKGVFNVTLPNLLTFNCQKLKDLYGIPVKSATAAIDGNEYFFGEYGNHLEFWHEKWGWDRRDRSTFELVRERYKGSLLEKFYDMNIGDGPFKRFPELGSI